MIDIKKLRDDASTLKAKWQSRGLDVDVDALLAKDKEWRDCISSVEELKKTRNDESKKIGQIKKSGGDATEQMAAVKKIGDDIKELDEKAHTLHEDLQHELLSLPNPPSDSSPVGKSEEDNPFVRDWGTKAEFDFKPQAHWDLGEKLGILDMERAAKISGSGFALYRGAGAKLERALINFFLDRHEENGYQENWTPFLVNSKTMTGTGQLPKFKEDLYHTEKDDRFLIPTAEVPVTNIYSEEILEKDDLPKYMCAYTPCFRREAGAAGKDTRGIIRMHQFNKVEMVKLVEPDQSYTELELLVADAEQLLQNLGLHYKVIELCTADIGFSAARCYDIEVWAPGIGRYLEVSSCSNFEDFQSRRANIRYRPEKGGKPTYLHTLNGSGLALPRCVVAIMETYQREDGSIEVPDALVPYMNGQTEITP
ncbi:MAG: serine--tRNA ligase [Lentisphaeraceae bacterium]|nr:serine--tRNA ligase [Lentisphaeraceae bacterium]